MTISIFAPAICGFLLVVIVLAFIFSPTFRRDLLANQGSTSATFFGILSVQGALIVAIIALLMGGLIYLTINDSQQTNGNNNNVPDLTTELQQATSENEKYKTKVEQLESKLVRTEKASKDLENQINQFRIDNESLKTKLGEVNERNAYLEEQVKKLAIDLKLSRKELSQIEGKNTALVNSELKELKNEISRKDKTIQELEVKIVNTKNNPAVKEPLLQFKDNGLKLIEGNPQLFSNGKISITATYMSETFNSCDINVVSFHDGKENKKFTLSKLKPIKVKLGGTEYILHLKNIIYANPNICYLNIFPK